MLQRMNRLEEAVHYYQESEVLDRSNMVASFKKAECFALLSKYDSAIQELQRLIRQVPQETCVQRLLGKLLQKVGRTGEAIHYMSPTMDLASDDFDVFVDE
jgi:predicted Zn-dependent protease